MIPALTDPHYNEKIAILNALHQVSDPELGVNIVDLGLVYDVKINDKEVLVEMTLSTPSCPMGNLITAHAKIAVEAALDGYEVLIRLVWEPRWNADRITPEGKAMLGW